MSLLASRIILTVMVAIVGYFFLHRIWTKNVDVIALFRSPADIIPVRESSESAESPQPAYVFLEPDKILEDLTLKIGEPPGGMLRVKNVGTKQAFELVPWRMMVLGPWPLPTEFNFPIQKDGQGMKTAQPGEVTFWKVGGDPTNKPITTEQYSKLLTGELRLYFYGRIEYKDALGNQRWTNYCFALTPPNDPNHTLFGIQMAPRHNDVDSIGRK